MAFTSPAEQKTPCSNFSSVRNIRQGKAGKYHHIWTETGVDKIKLSSDIRVHQPEVVLGIVYILKLHYVLHDEFEIVISPLATRCTGLKEYPVTAIAKKTLDRANMDEMADHARAATGLLKALAHETRLMILCLLFEGEKSVGELEQLMLMRQPCVSQQLARLRFDDLVQTRRDGRTIYYSLGSNEAEKVVTVLYDLYCGGKS